MWFDFKIFDLILKFYVEKNVSSNIGYDDDDDDDDDVMIYI